MISPENFIHLPYSIDLTRAGLAYTCKRIPQINALDDENPYKNLRQLVAQAGVELAIKRYLNNKKIPHNYSQLKHFTDPDHLTLIIGGHRCVIFNTIISNKKEITEVRKNPKILLRHAAKVSEHQIQYQQLIKDDIFIFTILECLITTSRRACQQAFQAKQPICQIALLPPPWSRSTTWSSLGNLSCQYQSEEELRLEIGGMDAKRCFITETVDIKPGREKECSKDFYNINYLVIKSVPNGTVSLTSSALKRTITTLPRDWRNIWLYGLGILLMGYITLGEFDHQTKAVRYHGNAFRSHPTQEKYIAMPMSNLSPLQNLFQQAKTWNKWRI